MDEFALGSILMLFLALLYKFFKGLSLTPTFEERSKERMKTREYLVKMGRHDMLEG